MANNNLRLYEGYFLFNNALRKVVVERLHASYGRGWWEAGVVRALGEETAARLRKQWSRRHGGDSAAKDSNGSSPDSLAQALDAGYFLPILQANWKGSFADTLSDRGKTEVWLGEIIDVRNRVMHPESTEIPDADTTRALDTMARFLHLLDHPDALKLEELRDSEPAEALGAAAVFELLGNAERGVRKLLAAALDGEGAESAAQQRLEEIFRETSSEFWGRTREDLDAADLPDKGKIRVQLSKLDELAREVTGRSFRDLAKPPARLVYGGPEEAIGFVRKLDGEIAELEAKIARKEPTIRLQAETGGVVERLAREVAELNQELENKRRESRRIAEECAPGSYFRVERTIDLEARGVYRVEAPIEVAVTVRNLGREAADLEYEESLPPKLAKTAGDHRLRGNLRPGEAVDLRYTVEALSPGRYVLRTATLDHPDRSAGWDEIEETPFQVEAAAPPNLAVARYFELKPGGIRVLTDLHNRGERVARDVRYRETVESGNGAAVTLEWTGSIRGGTSEVARSDLLRVAPEALRFTDRVVVGYRDAEGGEFEAALSPELKRIAYRFPATSEVRTPIVGRESEVDALGQLVEKVRASQPAKRLLLIEGIEGTGKTRLAQELERLAEGFAVHVEDAKTRSPVKRMIRRLLGLRPEEDRRSILDERLSELVDPEEHPGGSTPLLSFLTGQVEAVKEEDREILATRVTRVVKSLCARKPTLTVFENIHWTPEGVEEYLLVRLLHSAALDSHSRHLICVTYRPSDRQPVPAIGSLGVSRDLYTQITLEPLPPPSARALIDEIVDFPRFSNSLHRDVARWSTNPLYLLELVRLLTNPGSEFLHRVGGEWQLTPGTDLFEAEPPGIEKVILQRIQEELPEEIELARVLAAIGFELPLALVEVLVGLRFRDLKPAALGERLEKLEKAGILAPSEETDYRFEHHLKREVLYKSLPLNDQRHLREQIATLLLKQNYFSDPAEQTRQLARHLVRSPQDFQRQHLDCILKAARLESKTGNLKRSLDLYGVLTDLTPHDSFDYVQLLVDCGRLHRQRSDWIGAAKCLDQAYRLVGHASPLYRKEGKLARRLQISIEKEKGTLLLHQPRGSLSEANRLLFHARGGLEGFLHLRRRFPPKIFAFHRDLIEIYLELADLWIRIGRFEVAREACGRARALANRAGKRWPEQPLQALVYMKLGDLQRRQRAYAEARSSYEKALDSDVLDRQQRERVWLSLAEAWAADDCFPEAEEAYRRAIEGQTRVGDHYGLKLSYLGLGELMTKKGEYEAARDYARQAYDYHRESGDLEGFWRSCLVLSQIALATDDLPAAADSWFQARNVLFERGRIMNLRSDRREVIRALVERLVEHLKDRDAEKYLRCSEDLVRMSDPGSAGYGRGLLRLADAMLSAHDYPHAVENLCEAHKHATDPAVRAEALERLGDAVTAYEAGAGRVEVLLGETRGGDDLVEHLYKQAIGQYLRADNEARAVALLDRLLSYMLSDESSRDILPSAFLDVYRQAVTRSNRQRLVAAARDALLRANSPVAAAEVLVYTTRDSLGTDSGDPEGREELSRQLEEAESLYGQGEIGDQLWGLGMLIPAYFRLGGYEAKITACFEQIFDLSIKAEEPDGLLSAFSALGSFIDSLSIEDLQRLLAVALEASRQMTFSGFKDLRFRLQIAKFYSFIADRLDESPKVEEHHKLALEFYEEVLHGSVGESQEYLGLASSALNDSAILLKDSDRDMAIERLREAIQIENHSGGGSGGARVNLAQIIAETDAAEAKDLFEAGLEVLRRRVEQWDRRREDEHRVPLTSEEVARITYDNNWLRSAEVSYRVFLVQGLARRWAQRPV